MKPHRAICAALVTLTTVCVRGEELMDRVDQALTFSGYDDQVRARFSGLLDLEYYQFSREAPGLIYTDRSSLVNPRLSLFFDAQAGPNIYIFAQARVDRGFDPADSSMEARLDEYALRWTPWDDGRFSMQAGCFGTIVGNYVERHMSWENPFINAPLIYENVTGIYDSEAPSDASYFADGTMDAKYDYNPVIWGPSYATGLSVSGKLGEFEYAAEIKNAGLSSRPESWAASDRGFDKPTVSARLAWHPDMAWKLGVSASEGPYFTEHADYSLPPGKALGDYKQYVLGQDISFAWDHWQLWAEVYEARFDVPYVGHADTIGYYIEAKYKFTPNLSGALRWNQQLFADVPDGVGGERPWGNDLSRMDAAMIYRFTPYTQLKLQYSVQDEKRVDDAISHLFAAQFTLRF